MKDYGSGYRPFIGWVSGVSLAAYFLPYFIMGAIMWVATFIKTGIIIPYPVNAAALIELIGAILGMSALRTFEKIKSGDIHQASSGEPGQPSSH